jgi:AcrR family transcriptional regulator
MMITNTERFNALPQRQKKSARTRIALLDALLEELDSQPLAQVRIKDLTRRADVSEPTFFNYFDTKEHVLVYFIQLWSIQMMALARTCEAQTHSAIEAIKRIFVVTADEVVSHPQLMLEIISSQAQTFDVKAHDISDAEKWLYFNNIDGVDQLHGLGLESILPALIKKAIDAGEVTDTDPDLLYLTLSSLFFGTSLLLLKNDPQSLPQAFAAQLDFIFARASR